MSDLIERQSAIDVINIANLHPGIVSAIQSLIADLPSAQPDLITININHELTQKEYEKLRKDMANAPIMLLPSAQWDVPDTNVGKWIPVSERLPEEDKDVIVTRKFLGVKDRSHGWNNHIPPCTYVEVAKRIGDSWCSDSDEYKIRRSRHTDPIAWMPLPEPYTEVKNEID